MTRQDLYRGPMSWMARNPVAANVLMIALILGGLVASQSVRKEVFPQIELDEINVTMVYPGASPEEVEKGILLAIEESVRALDGVKEVRSTAAESVGTVTVELRRGANRNKAMTDVKNAIDRITSFPEEAEQPIVNMPEFQAEAISLIIYGDQDEKILQELGEQVRDELLALPDVTMAELSGVRPLEIAIEVSQDTLRKHNLTLPQIARLVRATAIELPAGAVKTKGGEVLLRTTERRDLATEFATVPIVSGDDGTPLLLGDLADIKDGYAETDIWAAFEGKRAVMINVTSVGNQSPPEVAEAVKRYVQTLQPKLPPGVMATTYLDRSKLYDERVDLLLRNAMLGLSLVLLILGLFLELRLAFWVTMGIPISFLGSLILLPSLGVSLNMISLFAFIVTLGMVVDDAIVVGENTFRFRREGYGPLKAAIMGARQVAVPVFFSIATTVAAFSPLLFIPGVRGKWMIGIPIVVILVLLLSLIESFFILPAHLAHLRKRTDEQKGIIGRAQERISRAIEGFVERTYVPVVGAAIRHRWMTLAVALAVFIGSVGLVAGGRVKTIDFPKEESDWVVAVARMPFGVAVEETEAVMDRMVRAAKETMRENGGEEIGLGVFSMVGVSFGGHGGGGGGGGSHLTSVLVTLVSTDQRPISSFLFADTWRKKIGEVPGLESLSLDSSTGHGSSKPIDIQISHRDIAVLEAAARDMATELAQFKGVVDIDNGIQLGKPQLDFTLSPAGINAGFTSAELAAQVRAAFYGAEALRQQRGRNEIRALVRLPRSDRETLHSVEELMVRAPNGGEMPLRQAAQVNYGRAYTAINRTDGKRNIRVQADIDEELANQQEIMAAVYSKVVPGLKARHQGLMVGAAGRQKDFQDFMNYLKVGFMIALLGMLVLIAVPLKSYVLQPLFVVMMAIPFGFTGAVLGHLMMGMPMSMISMMGLVALAGVVVNDSLVLVTAANEFRAGGMTPTEAAMAAAHQRFRPVILTSLTTFGGLAPMIFETSVQARVLIPMAVSLGFGVLFSTLVTLILVPSLFTMIENLRELLRRFWRWVFPGEDDAAIDMPPQNTTGELP